jgi:Ca2+-binding EF-hand superfamily protein
MVNSSTLNVSSAPSSQPSSTPSPSACLFDLPSLPSGDCILDKGILTDAQMIALGTLFTTALLMYLGWLLVQSRQKKLERLRRITHYLTAEEIVELQVHAPNFSETILRKLFIRFMNLDWDRNGTLTCNEFCTMPELKCNPLSYRLFDAFDVNEDGHLDFAEFVVCVHVMSPLATANDKAAAMFRIYDVDSDGMFQCLCIVFCIVSLLRLYICIYIFLTWVTFISRSLFLSKNILYCMNCITVSYIFRNHQSTRLKIYIGLCHTSPTFKRRTDAGY